MSNVIPLRARRRACAVLADQAPDLRARLIAEAEEGAIALGARYGEMLADLTEDLLEGIPEMREHRDIVARWLSDVAPLPSQFGGPTSAQSHQGGA